MKKVFILTNTLKSGGAEKQSIYLTRSLHAHYDVTLIIYYGDQFDQRMTALLDGVENQVVWLKGNHISKIVKVYKLFKEYRNAVVISYLATTNVINAIVGSLAGIKCKIGGRRSSTHHPAKLFIQRVLHNQILTNSVVNNYCGLENLIQKGFREDKCTVIHNGIPVNIGVQIREHTKNLNLLTVGRFIQSKDY